MVFLRRARGLFPPLLTKQRALLDPQVPPARLQGLALAAASQCARGRAALRWRAAVIPGHPGAPGLYSPRALRSCGQGSSCPAWPCECILIPTDTLKRLLGCASRWGHLRRAGKEQFETVSRKTAGKREQVDTTSTSPSGLYKHRSQTRCRPHLPAGTT